MSKRNFTRLSETLSLRFDLNDIRLILWKDETVQIYWGNTPMTVAGDEAKILNSMIDLPHEHVVKLSPQTAINLNMIQAIRWTKEPLSAQITFNDDWTYMITDADAAEFKKLIGHTFDNDPETSLGRILHSQH